MFQLTREVRFAINADSDDPLERSPTNSFGGYPSLNGLGVFLAAQITVRGELDPRMQWLINIKDVDDTAREFLRTQKLQLMTAPPPTAILKSLWQHLSGRFREQLDRVSLSLSPTLAIAIQQPEFPMMRLSQKFEFSASHRLHNPALPDDQNRDLYGKCNNPLGHGHNYELQVTLRARGDGALPADVSKFERLVKETVIDRFDHRNLNAEIPEFRELIPSVENIAMVIYRLLKDRMSGVGELASVTVWETPKTWCEYSE